MRQAEPTKYKKPSITVFPLFTFILKVQKFQLSFELYFVFQFHAYFSASEKELSRQACHFLLYQTKNVKEIGETLVKLVHFCLTRHYWIFFNLISLIRNIKHRGNY
jgi:hypothetical protein